MTFAEIALAVCVTAAIVASATETTALSFYYYGHLSASNDEPMELSQYYHEQGSNNSDVWAASYSYYGTGLSHSETMFDPLVLPEDRLRSALPLVWLHVPKTGSSIANSLLRLPGVCPELAKRLGDASFAGGNEDGQFRAFYEEGLCPGLATSALPNTAPGFHRTVGSEFAGLYDGHGVTLLRQPEQRIISALRHVANATDEDLEGLPISAGCTVRMLVDEQTGPFPWTAASEACFAAESSPVPSPSREDVQLAQERLRKFAFVGLMEEWHLSVCLLHAMFGGDCSPAEFENSRPSPSSKHAYNLRHRLVEAVYAAPEPYDVGVLGGFIDEADRAVYETGSEIFWKLCDAHSVTPQSCKPCFQSAGTFV